MKVTNSVDGIPRITLRVETRLSAYDIAIHLICGCAYEEGMQSFPYTNETLEQYESRLESAIKRVVSKLSEKEILDKVRDNILLSGTETPVYRVADEGFSNLALFLEGYIVERFKGFLGKPKD